MILHFSFWRTLHTHTHTHNGWKWSIWFFFFGISFHYDCQPVDIFGCAISVQKISVFQWNLFSFFVCVCVCVWNYLTGFVIVWQKKKIGKWLTDSGDVGKNFSDITDYDAMIMVLVFMISHEFFFMQNWNLFLHFNLFFFVLFSHIKQHFLVFIYIDIDKFQYLQIIYVFDNWNWQFLIIIIIDWLIYFLQIFE